MRVLILGGDGFCGWPTALHLSARGWDVLVVDNLSRRNIDNELEVQGGGSVEPEMAEAHFHHYSPIFEIGSEIDFVCSEANRLRLRYPKIPVAPMLYKVEDNRLYLIDE